MVLRVEQLGLLKFTVLYLVDSHESEAAGGDSWELYANVSKCLTAELKNRSNSSRNANVR